jgi:hypothetical protein
MNVPPPALTRSSSSVPTYLVLLFLQIRQGRNTSHLFIKQATGNDCYYSGNYETATCAGAADGGCRLRWRFRAGELGLGGRRQEGKVESPGHVGARGF